MPYNFYEIPIPIPVYISIYLYIHPSVRNVAGSAFVLFVSVHSSITFNSMSSFYVGDNDDIVAAIKSWRHFGM